MQRQRLGDGVKTKKTEKASSTKKEIKIVDSLDDFLGEETKTKTCRSCEEDYSLRIFVEVGEDIGYFDKCSECGLAGWVLV